MKLIKEISVKYVRETYINSRTHHAYTIRIVHCLTNNMRNRQIGKGISLLN